MIVSSYNRLNKALYIRFRGQSNSKGNVPATNINDLDTKYKGTFENVKVFDGTEGVFKSLDTINDNFNQFPVGEREGGFGAEISCAIELQKLTGYTIYFSKYSVGGTTLQTPSTKDGWNPNVTNELFDKSESNEDWAVNWLINNNIEYKDLGEIYYQGENDAGLEIQEYTDLLNSYINKRLAFSKGKTFTIIQLDSTFSNTVGWNNIITAQNNVANSRADTFIKGNDGQYERDLVNEGNEIHINSRGQMDLGKDLAYFIVQNILNFKG